LEVSALAKAFSGEPVLRGLDLVVPAGSLTAVLGPSGCGKTTLLRLIAGFERADAGRIAVSGAAVAGDRLHVAPERRRVGYVAQEGALFPHLSAADNVAFGLARRHRRGSRVPELLEMVGLAGLGDRMPHELSGGQQQRVALARALAPEPALVLLDEPFSALDPALREQVRTDVCAALRSAGATAVLVTHDQTEALSVADRVGVLLGGRIVQLADPAVLYRSPATPQIAAFVGDAVLLPGRWQDGRVLCALGAVLARPTSADGTEVTALFRPEQLRLCAPEAAAICGQVTSVQFYGHDATVQLEVAHGDAPAAVMARLPGHLAPAPGSHVGLAVHHAAAVFPASDPQGALTVPWPG
jgi:iron(III) transport system ATP-binding protein